MASETCTTESQGLFDTSVTLKAIEEKLQEALNTSAVFGANATTTQIARGQGFLSVMVRLKPDWQGNNTDKLPTSFVIKIPTSVTSQKASEQISLDEMMKDHQTDVQFTAEGHTSGIEKYLRVAHASEIAFYELVNQEQLKVKVPKCFVLQKYGSSGENGLLIMKDLCDIAATKPINEGLSIEAVKEVLENLAEVHAYSLQNDQWLHDDNLKATLSKYQKENGDNLNGLTIGAMDKFKKDHPALFDPLIDRLREECLKEYDLGFLDTIHEELGLPPILTHGDLWMNNMMWRKADGRKGTTDELVAIVDWQIVHPGCIGEDFVRLMCSSVDPAVRREHLTDFMEFYHASLKSKLGKEPPFTVGQIIYAYKRIFRYGLLLLIPCFLGFIQPEFGMMGSEDIDKKINTVLERVKCFIEDLYVYEDELGLNK
uniref:CHK kinase-like domain-containing protein n=1 Tax=Plectus sambesii TaxID=2011161 RepID=A0A914VSZ2_9BILA